MIHLKDIRKAVADTLIAANIPTVLDKVFASRARMIWPEEGDFLCVYTQVSNFEDNDTSPVIYTVDTDIVVQVIAQDATTEQAIEDRLDTITDAVVRTLLKEHGISGPFSGKLEWIYLKSIRPTLSAEGEVLKCSQSIEFEGRWRITLPSAGPTDDFLSTHTTLGSPTDTHAPALDSIFITNMRTT